MPIVRSTRRLAVAVLAVVALASGACSGDDGAGGDGSSSSTTEARPTVDVRFVLAKLAQEVIVPAYGDLGEGLEEFVIATGTLCASPSDAALDAARDSWRAVAQAWQRTRAFGVGPALEQRLMSDIGFAARERVITLVLDGTDPVDEAAIAEEGAAARGIYAAEELLFGDGSDALVTGEPRRCQYAQSVAALAARATEPVVEQWRSGDATDRFASGLDGGPQSTVALLVNEVSHRLDEVDAMQLRDMAAADGPEELDVSRLGGPADQRIAERQALLSGIADVIDIAIGLELAPEASVDPIEPIGGNRMSLLVEAHDPETADRLVASAEAATSALAELPPSVSEAFEDPEAIEAAAEAVAELKVLLSTEVASLLGVTITFSDSDGDS